jgi:hypothetical protein
MLMSKIYLKNIYYFNAFSNKKNNLKSNFYHILKHLFNYIYGVLNEVNRKKHLEK